MSAKDEQMLLLKFNFLEWIRQQENEELYYELLTLGPVMLDELLTLYGDELRKQAVSRMMFAEMLDQLHITYCVPKPNRHGRAVSKLPSIAPPRFQSRAVSPPPVPPQQVKPPVMDVSEAVKTETSSAQMLNFHRLSVFKEMSAKTEQMLLLKFNFLEWIRQQENEELYYELLTLGPIMLDELLTLYGDELRKQGVSRMVFAETLDQLHITYCVPKPNRQDTIAPSRFQSRAVISSPVPLQQVKPPVVDVKLLKEISSTPMPNFDAMSDAELNANLERVGLKPMVRKKAIATLKKIYDATHPEQSESTPLATKVTRVLMADVANRPGVERQQALAREKRTMKAIAQMTASDRPASPRPAPTLTQLRQDPTEGPLAEFHQKEMWDHYRSLMRKLFS